MSCQTPSCKRLRSGSGLARRSGSTSDRKSTRLNSSYDQISYAVFCLKKKKIRGRNTSVSARSGDRETTRVPLSPVAQVVYTRLIAQDTDGLVHRTPASLQTATVKSRT